MSYAQMTAMTFPGKLDQIMKSRGLTNEEVAKKIRQPQRPDQARDHDQHVRDSTYSVSEPRFADNPFFTLDFV